MKTSFNLRRFWIRRDRNQYLLGGVIITSLIGSYVSAHWHFVDKVNTIRSMKVYSQERSQSPARNLREVEYTPSKQKAGRTRYYQLDTQKGPAIPRLDESEEDTGN
ncbi:MAG: hypothetical protein A2234_01110 [Elusimicrobia bacterium RIFOXYA2_FULL_58_8]|nr:MAG: hypothetical protein A2285_02375 [Elusimicrobia bacterium RIFOXYA12_FULL_57_11]OGS16962.1 MAG: hypothetical protein A2234_01110 [Elusimicrobia bacterium RIFOXYA2_FULL_58_8]